MDTNEPLHESRHEESEPLHEAWLSLHDAAAALGISPRAVQLRAERGKLARDRRDGRVVFCVPLPKPLHAENESVHEAQTPAEAMASVSYVAHLESEVAFLRAQVEAHQTNEGELRRLMLADKRELSELREQVKMLAAPTVEEGAQAAQEPRTGVVEADMGNPPPEQPRDGQSATGLTRKWWQFWR
jgi:hypothetical protein